MRAAFRATGLLKRLLKLLATRFGLGTKLPKRLPLAAQRLERLILGEFGMTDLGLQIAHYALGFREHPLRPVTRRRLGSQSRLGSLQTAAAGRARRDHAAMRRCFVSLVPSQHGNRDIAILHKAAPVQSAIEAVTHTAGLLHPFRL